MIVRWANGNAVVEASTESRDVSSRGVYFFLPEAIPSGSLVEFTLTLPPEITLSGPIDVRCLGRISRVDADGPGRVGLAAQIARYEFLHGTEKAA